MTSRPGASSDAPLRASSPSNSLYAMSDDDEGGYDTIASTGSQRGVKLLYSKSKVYVHPTSSSKDNISGYIALLQQKSTLRTSSSTREIDSIASADLLLAWVPESSLGDSESVYVKVDLCEGDEPPKQSYLVRPPPTVTSVHSAGGYAFAVPVSAIYSLQVRPPNLGWWYGSIIINSRAGDSFPPLFFHDNECQSTILQKKKLARDTFDPFGEGGHMFWGGDEVVKWLKRYVQMERSAAEPNVYLIEPSKEDALSFGSGAPGPSAAPGQRAGQGSAQGGGGGRPQPDPLAKFLRDAGWNLMNQFSKVTTFTRRAAQDLAENPNVPPQVKRLLRTPEVQTLQDEFDSAKIYLARWAMGIAEQSERDRRSRMWTATDVMELEDTDVGEFELLDGTSGLSVEDMRKPVTLKEWQGFFNPQTGHLSITADEVKDRIFHGGLDPEDGVRKEAWLFLLGVYDWYSSADERKAQIASLRDQYYRLKLAWWERLDGDGGQGEAGEWWREQRSRIEKDVHRTDRSVPIFEGEDTPHPDPNSPFADVGTNVHLEQLKEMLLAYNEYNRELGYVQGMSDLLAPIYAVIQDDAVAFWAFQKFMERMERNFLRDQSGMRTQLLTLDQLVHFMDPKLWDHLQAADSTNFFFFFRMILVWYKREFPWMDILRLWEALWTDRLSANFHLFIAMAILEKHRDVIMTHLKHFDEVLKYINELSNTMDLESTLIKAEALFRRFQRLVEVVDKKHNFPAPSKKDTATSSSVNAAASSSTPPNNRGHQHSASSQKNKDETQGITPELRVLLSRKVEVLPRTEVAQKGDGMSAL
ncbi:TBC1 domain family member 15 [Geosmithia morbida]|uniref:GTPase-activating protein GYP7 n=1 Tax=Geosmithia morbida TaxID=1094350 RepID=A0A9P4YRK0_9HYPO|nr:TBC1 domain family member 15 [Geosmithia morbida]KAF4120775.1 TBC1 domain family member 15 [Geosmithia morbida]